MKIKYKSHSEVFQHLFKLISSQRFLTRQGLGKEVPFFICPFAPKDSIEMSKNIQKLEIKLKQNGIIVLKINLYDLTIDILKKRKIWEKIIKMEKEKSKAELLELFQSVLDPEKHLIPSISDIINESTFNVMFLTGIGEVFPYIRSHNVLYNLQAIAIEYPTVMFFPGNYTHSPEKGASLDLFNKLHDDNYYRAFNIFDCEV